MKLPDYTKCVEVNLLLQQMGIKKIPHLPPIKFERTVIKTTERVIPNTQQLNFAHNLKFNSIDVSSSDITITQNDLIEINGIKCCIYIKNQRNGVDITTKTSEYRFHLCNCHTVQEMIRSGRGSRYVATSRDDGLFTVTPQGWQYGKAREYELYLDLCNNCKNILISRGMYFSNFSLKEFYSRYQPDIPQTFKRPEQVQVTEQYAPNQQEISQAYKQKVSYRCQLCQVDCSAHPEFLNLHHKDGDGNNNKPENLSVLCIDCHRHQPFHSQMNNHKNNEVCLLINELRKAQGIYSCNY